MRTFPHTKRPTDSIETRMRQCMAMIEERAATGKRAPTMNEFLSAIPGAGPALKAIVDKGWVESRWYGRRYRVFYIKRGPLTGKCTQLPPAMWRESKTSREKRGAL